MSEGIAPLSSQRLHYRRLSAEDLNAFHSLIVDEHVRRYLLDGLTMDRQWSVGQVSASDALFAQRGVGIWLAFLAEQQVMPLGFCGFIRFEETGPEPQLLYALLAEHAGQGHATEMAQALIEYVRQHTGATEVFSAVDEPNAASSRVLTKLGFQRTGDSPGAFGRILHYRLPLEQS